MPTFLQATPIVVTFAVVTLPVPPVTVQNCAGAVGWVVTVTLYVVPLAEGPASVNAPAPDAGLAICPLTESVSTRPLPV